MTKLIIVRHGETTWNVENKAQGSMNIKLSDEGVKQAKKLADRLSKYEIDTIYSSDLDRAYATAKEVACKIKKNIMVDNRLREMSFGNWEGLTISEIKKNYEKEYVVWRNEPHNASITNGETLIEVQKRTLEMVNEIINSNKGKTVLLVSHGMAIKTLILGIMEMPLSDFYKITQGNTCINIIEFKEYGPVIKTLNDRAHLENL